MISELFKLAFSFANTAVMLAHHCFLLLYVGALNIVTPFL